jgi:L-alanine-DL-glutamate epimerase-like enolase superfamily enzyme
LKLSYTPYSLEFKHPFGLAYGTRTTTELVYCKLEAGNFTSYGEAALPPYLKETQSSVINFLEKARIILEKHTLTSSIEVIMKEIDALAPGNTAAQACVDMALYDLKAKAQNKAVYELLGLNKPVAKDTSVTISIGNLDLIPQKLEELTEYAILKVKLGNKNDSGIIDCIRRYTAKPLVVDINQGWADKQFALEMIQWLHVKQVLYVEQPLAKDAWDDMDWLSERSPIPIIADESMQRLCDMDKVANCFHGINLKLMKCSGLYEAVKIIDYAKDAGLKINIGCMSESSCGIAAAAQLMTVADWIDLDGPLLIKNNPFSGISFSEGKLHLDSFIGTGASLINTDITFRE